MKAGLLWAEVLFGLRRHLRTGQHARQGRLGLSVNAPHSPLFALLALQFEARMEVVVQLPVGPLDQRIDRRHHFGVVMPLITKALANVRPVLLLHMRLVVFLVGPLARPEHRPLAFLPPATHVLLYKLRSARRAGVRPLASKRMSRPSPGKRRSCCS